MLVFLFLSLFSSCLSRQYYFVNEFLTWTEAQTYCRQTYTDLATLENTNDTSSVMIAAANSSNYSKAWIGLYDDMLNSWRWSYDDDTFYGVGEKDYRNWRTNSNEPNNLDGNEMCTNMYFVGDWQDLPCQSQLNFICYNKSNNSYVLITEYMNWSDAQQYCRQYHTDLASIRNATENQIIVNLGEGYPYFWIGLYRTRTWSDQSNSTYQNWQPGQPDNANYNQHCTAVSNSGQWSDEKCEETLPFFCYSDSPVDPAHKNVIALRVRFTSERNLTAAEIESLMQQVVTQSDNTTHLSTTKMQLKSVKKKLIV